MKKVLFFAVAAITISFQCAVLHRVQAAPVDEATARRVAVNFWNTYRPVDVDKVTDLVAMSADGLQHQYVFSAGERGFVIVASDDCVRPILGYSFTNPFPTRLHPELRYWLEGYDEQIAYAMSVAPGADPRWSSLLNDEVPPEPVSVTEVSPLCHTTWDQGDPWNRQCPWDGQYNDRTVVGCVATAMAQIMKRWNHPSCGTGSHSYEYGDYGVLSADFANTTYRWEVMPNTVHFATSDEKALALSTISYHCGVAVDMMYGTTAVGGSGAYSSCGYWATACAEHAFYEFFKYDSSLHHLNRDGYDDDAWLAMIDADLAAGRPMYYSGSDSTGGHAFVLDGSNLDTTYHFNWGWQGYGDGFYYMSNLAPGSGGIGGNSTYSFNRHQGAIFGIQPVPEVFDTIDLYDTVCSNYTEYRHGYYTLPPVTADTCLRHLNTITHLRLKRVNSNFASFSENRGRMGGEMFEVEYCYKDGLAMPECPYTKQNCRFVGWSRERSGDESPIYFVGDTIEAHGNITLYARWQDTTVGIAEPYIESVNLWPNPTTGDLTVSLGLGHEGQVLVIDAVGRTLLRENLMNGSVRISLADLPAGSYTVQVSTAMGVFNRRIIKQ